MKFYVAIVNRKIVANWGGDTELVDAQIRDICGIDATTAYEKTRGADIKRCAHGVPGCVIR